MGIQRRRVNWILDADIQGFFDTLNHEWLIRFLEHRRRILRRRSQGSAPNEAWLARLFARWLPRPRTLHPYPEVRFDAKYPR